MSTRISTQPATVPTVRVDRHTVTVAGATVGYCDLIDADTFAARIRGALAEAFTAGRREAQREVAAIIERAGATNADDILDGCDATDGIIDWVTQ